MAKQPINVTAATLTVDRDTHAGTVVTVNKADGCTITLPAAVGKGDEYTFYCGTTITSVGLIIKVANSSDTMAGGVAISGDIAGVTMLAGGTNDTITMNGTTTGGIAGSWVTLKDVAATKWMVNGFLCSNTSEATPFSATV
jgi:hypothetical protein